jgi:thiamine pyrophosphokinase
MMCCADGHAGARGEADMGQGEVVVFAGGPAPGRHVRALLPEGAVVIAADRGGEHALALGLEVAVAVGDFDSIAPAALATLEAGGTRIERHPQSKAASDLELALDLAAALEPRRIVVVGGAPGRLDHLLGELLLLGSEAYAAIELDALLGRSLVQIVRGTRELHGRPRELLSLFALNGPAEGVATEGLVYPLGGERLQPGSSRGLSNLFAGDRARVEVARGVVAALRPGLRASLLAPD